MSEQSGPPVPTRVLLIGSTGAMGRAVLRHADERSIRIRAFARRPESLLAEAGPEAAALDAVRGDVRDRESIVRALDGVDAVVCTLGGKPWHRDAKGVHEAGTRNLVSAMRERGCRRLIAVTGVGAGSSRGHGPFYYNWFARPTLLRSVYADKERQEDLIRASGLDWTIVRPSNLVPRTPPTPILSNSELRPREKMGPISRDDVARFLLAEARQSVHREEIVHLYT